ncbi:MAG: GMC family oxidoreductase N-terminal domain-containing protein, partial [Photobacterium halotolerans]
MSALAEEPLAQSQFDFIIVGGGSAGCVLAARLSEDSHKRVLLLEAGPESDAHLADSPLADASRLVLEGYNWSYQAQLKGSLSPASDLVRHLSAAQQKDKYPPPFDYRVGKVLGGSSAVNGAVALRTFPRDFARWAEMGCPQWSWQHVLPWYRRLETDTDFPGDDLHGDQGPMVLRRPDADSLHPLDRAFSAACQKQGIPYT